MNGPIKLVTKLKPYNRECTLDLLRGLTHSHKRYEDVRVRRCHLGLEATSTASTEKESVIDVTGVNWMPDQSAKR